MKLLIIDDEPHIRQMMRLTLEAAGSQVDEASTGEEGLKQFGDGRGYAAVLLDQKMPGMDGLQTLKALKARAPGACVIMVTAFASIELAVDAMKLGATDFLRKPMTPEMLRGAVAAALASRPPEPIARSAAAGGRVTPPIETLTLNGFRITRSPDSIDPAASEHVFQVTHFPDADGADGYRRDRSGGGGQCRTPHSPSTTTGRCVLAGAGAAAAVVVPVERREAAGERPADCPRRSRGTSTSP